MGMDMVRMKKMIGPYMGVMLLQLGSAGSAIIAKSALNNGMSHYTFSVYRNIIAALLVSPFAFLFERKVRPRMSMSAFIKILLLALLEPVMDQNLYYGGMKYTTATLATALCNMVPAITFSLAIFLRLEKVNLKRIESQAKIVGTLVTFGGAMIMTLVKGPPIGLPWSSSSSIPPISSVTTTNNSSSLKGALMVTAGCFCCASFYILQAITLKTYPAPLSLTAFICMAGSLLGTVLTLLVEGGNSSIWAIHWDNKLLAYIYSGLIGSGASYYVAGTVIKGKGPVFVTSFNPLSMVIVAVLSSFIFAEKMNVGKITGASVIVVGLYLVIWGKARDHKKAEANAEEEYPYRNGEKLPELKTNNTLKDDDQHSNSNTILDQAVASKTTVSSYNIADCV